MTLSIDTNPIFPSQNNHLQSARKLVRNVEGHELTLSPEKAKEDQQPQLSAFTFRKQLTPEEEKRVQFLKDTMAQILTMAEGQPTEEQKARIREIEEELEKITSVKMQSRVSDVTAKMVGTEKEEDDEEEEKKNALQAQGTNPQDAIHTRMPEKQGQANPGLMAIQQNALHTQLRTMLDGSSLSLKGVTT